VSRSIAPHNRPNWAITVIFVTPAVDNTKSGETDNSAVGGGGGGNTAKNSLFDVDLVALNRLFGQ
jgi:hypothetical protein